MRHRIILMLGLFTALALSAGRPAAGDASPLTDADRRAFAWFDGIGLPSCAGKPYVRITWVDQSTSPDAPRAERVWELDGFIVAEDAGVMTILDGDLWPRKVPREGSGDWSATIEPLDLAKIAEAAAARLRAIVEDPGAVESVDDLFRGMRIRFGDEGQALAFARHCAENGLEREAHALLEAARALPRVSGSTSADAPIEEIAAAQMGEGLIWRIIFDFQDEAVARSRLLERLRGWHKSFPASRHLSRADEAIRILEPMVAEEATHRPVSDAQIAGLASDLRARELVYRLRDQPGDVAMSWAGAVYIDTEGGDTPVGRLVAMGMEAVPALIDALTDERFTRAVLFRADTAFSRQYVARVGDMARVALERITRQCFWEPTRAAPSMFQVGEQAKAQSLWKAWSAGSADFVTALRALASETDPATRLHLARTLPDRGSGPLAGAARAVWGTKTFMDAVPGLDADAAKDLLRVVIGESLHPRTKALAAWALLDLGERGAIAEMIRVWTTMTDAARADPEQGGAVASFLAACGDASAVVALGAGLDERPAAVRELVVLAFDNRGLGALRGFAANAPDGVRERWALTGAAAEAAEDLVAARLADLEVDPLGRIPRQVPLCDMVPEYDCGCRIADAAIRVLARRWPAVYPMKDEPVRPVKDWEALRTTFLEAWEASKAKRAPK